MMRPSPNKPLRLLTASAWSCLLAAALLPLFCSCRALPTVEPEADRSVAAPPAGYSAAQADRRPEDNRRADNAPEENETAPATWSLSDEGEPPRASGIAPVSAEQQADEQLPAGVESHENTESMPPAMPLASLPSHGAPLDAGAPRPLGPVAAGQPHSPALPHHAPHRRALSAPTSLPAIQPHPGLPAAAYTGSGCSCCPSPGAGGKWSPPGIKQPWPEDEYLCDGGDQETRVRVDKDWTVWGLDQEDTIAHFDTKDGRTIVEPSNCVCIYSPRFSAVRRVDGLVQYKQRQHMAGMEAPLSPGVSEERLVPSTVNQPLQPQRHLAATPLDIFQERTRGLTVDRAEVPAAAENAFRPYEDFLMIRRGQYDASEKPRLAERIDAALAWTHADAVQVVIDEQLASEAVGQSKLESVYTYELKGKPRLRICKIASTRAARPGEIVEFTLRFDNVGDQTIGNVTIIDHLTTRLEYVEESQSSTLDADFFAIDDQDVSLILRWEIKEPVKVGEGGLIRFKCRVR